MHVRPIEQQDSNSGWIKSIFSIVLVCSLFVIMPAHAQDSTNDCPDTCYKNTEYVDGERSRFSKQCSYTENYCEYGCGGDGRCLQLKNYEVYPWDIKPIESAECPNYCQDYVAYRDGYLNEKTGECEYYKDKCPFGCGDTTCTPDPDDVCPAYCQDGFAYRESYYDDYMEECVYVSDECFFGCGDVTCTPIPNDVCPAYCQDGFAYREGYYNEYTNECVYVEDECLFGCGDVTCTPEPEDICSDYCANGKAYREGYFDEETRDCVYVEDICHSGCDDDYCAVLECASYCEDGTRYYDGWDDEGTCYFSEEECLFGCDGAACARSQRIPSDAAPQFGSGGGLPPPPEIDTDAVSDALSEPDDSFNLQNLFRFLAGLFNPRPEPARLTLDRCEAGSPRVLYGDTVRFGAVVRNDGNTNARAELVNMSIVGTQANFTGQSGDIAPGAERIFWFETRASDHQYKPIIRFGSTTATCPEVNVVPPSEGIDLVMENLPQNQTISKYDENVVRIRIRNMGPELWKYTNDDIVVRVRPVKENSSNFIPGASLWHNIRRGNSDYLDLAAGDAIELEDHLTLQPGVYHINVTLDPDRKWTEYFESNNQHSYTVTVTDELPDNVGDLVPIACEDAAIEEQKNMMIDITVQNKGAHPITIPAETPLAKKVGSVGLSPQYLSRTLVLQPGDTFNITLLGGNYNIAAGEHTYAIEVNAEDLIAETDRSNNNIQCRIRVLPQQHFADLVIVSATGRQYGRTVNETVVHINLSNQGTEYAVFRMYQYDVISSPSAAIWTSQALDPTAPITLAPGSSVIKSMYPRRPLNDRWILKADPYNVIRESDESNNEFVFDGR